MKNIYNSSTKSSQVLEDNKMILDSSNGIHKTEIKDKDFLEEFSKWKYQLRRHGYQTEALAQDIKRKHYSSSSKKPFIIITSVSNHQWKDHNSFFDPFAAEADFRKQNHLGEQITPFFVINNHNNIHWDYYYRSSLGKEKIEASREYNSCGAYTLISIICHHQNFLNLPKVKEIIEEVKLEGATLTYLANINLASAWSVRYFLSASITKDWNSNVSLLKKNGIIQPKITQSLQRIETLDIFLTDEDIIYAAIALDIDIYQVQSFRKDQPDLNLLKQNIRINLSDESKRTRSRAYQAEYTELMNFCLDHGYLFENVFPKITDQKEIKIKDNGIKNNFEVEHDLFLKEILIHEKKVLDEELRKLSQLKIACSYQDHVLTITCCKNDTDFEILMKVIEPIFTTRFASRTRTDQIRFESKEKIVIISAQKNQNSIVTPIPLLQILTAEDISNSLKEILADSSYLKTKINQTNGQSDLETDDSSEDEEKDQQDLKLNEEVKSRIQENRVKVTQLLLQDYKENKDFYELNSSALEGKTAIGKNERTTYHRKYQLSYYQKYVDARILYKKEPVDMVLPVFTSFGKTFFMINIAKFELACNNIVLFVFPYIALAEQFEKECKKFAPEITRTLIHPKDFKIKNKDSKETSSKKLNSLFKERQIYLSIGAGLQQLYDKAEKHGVQFPFYQFSIIFFDEAHRYGTKKWQNIIYDAKIQGCARILATATPYSLGSKSNLNPYQLLGLTKETNILPLMGIKEAIEQQLAPPIQFIDIAIDYHQLALGQSEEEIILNTKAYLISALLFEAVDPFTQEPLWKYQWIIFTPNIPFGKLIIRQIQERLESNKYKVLVELIKQHYWEIFSQNHKIKRKKTTEDDFKNEFKIAEQIDCSSNKKETKKLIRLYKSGKILAMVNPRMLSEGFDNQRTKVVLITNNAFSFVQLMQQIGRCTRLTAPPSIAYCLQILDQSTYNLKLARQISHQKESDKSYELKLFQTADESEQYIKMLQNSKSKTPSFALYNEKNQVWVCGINSLETNLRITHIKIIDAISSSISEEYIEINRNEIIQRIQASFGLHLNARDLFDNHFKIGIMENLYRNAFWVKNLFSIIFASNLEVNNIKKSAIEISDQALQIILTILAYTDNFMDSRKDIYYTKNTNQSVIPDQERKFEFEIKEFTDECKSDSENQYPVAQVFFKYEAEPFPRSSIKQNDRKKSSSNENNHSENLNKKSNESIIKLKASGFSALKQFIKSMETQLLVLKMIDPIRHSEILESFDLFLKLTHQFDPQASSEKKLNQMTHAIQAERKLAEKNLQLLYKLPDFSSIEKKSPSKTTRNKSKNNRFEKDILEQMKELYEYAARLNLALSLLLNPFKHSNIVSITGNMSDQLQVAQENLKQSRLDLNSFISQIYENFPLKVYSSQDFLNHLKNKYQHCWPTFIDWIYILFFSDSNTFEGSEMDLKKAPVFGEILFSEHRNLDLNEHKDFILNNILDDINQWCLSKFTLKIVVIESNGRIPETENNDMEITIFKLHHRDFLVQYKIVYKQIKIIVNPSKCKKLTSEIENAIKSKKIEDQALKQSIIKIIIKHEQFDINLYSIANRYELKHVLSKKSNQNALLLVKHNQNILRYEYHTYSQYWQEMIDSKLTNKLQSLKFPHTVKEFKARTSQQLSSSANQYIKDQYYIYSFLESSIFLRAKLEIATLILKDAITLSFQNKNNELNYFFSYAYNGYRYSKNIMSFLSQENLINFFNIKKLKDDIFLNKFDIMLFLLNLRENYLKLPIPYIQFIPERLSAEKKEEYAELSRILVTRSKQGYRVSYYRKNEYQESSTKPEDNQQLIETLDQYNQLTFFMPSDPVFSRITDFVVAKRGQAWLTSNLILNIDDCFISIISSFYKAIRNAYTIPVLTRITIHYYLIILKLLQHNPNFNRTILLSDLCEDAVPQSKQFNECSLLLFLSILAKFIIYQRRDLYNDKPNKLGDYHLNFLHYLVFLMVCNDNVEKFRMNLLLGVEVYIRQIPQDIEHVFKLFFELVTDFEMDKDINFTLEYDYILNLKRAFDGIHFLNNQLSLFHLVIMLPNFLRIKDALIHDFISIPFDLIFRKDRVLFSNLISVRDKEHRNCLHYSLVNLDPIKNQKIFGILFDNIKRLPRTDRIQLIQNIDIEGNNLFQTHFKYYFSFLVEYEKSFFFLLEQILTLIGDFQVIKMMLFAKNKDSNICFLTNLVSKMVQEMSTNFLAEIFKYEFSITDLAFLYNFKSTCSSDLLGEIQLYTGFLVSYQDFLKYSPQNMNDKLTQAFRHWQQNYFAKVDVQYFVRHTKNMLKIADYLEFKLNKFQELLIKVCSNLEDNKRKLLLDNPILYYSAVDEFQQCVKLSKEVKQLYSEFVSLEHEISFHKDASNFPPLSICQPYVKDINLLTNKLYEIDLFYHTLMEVDLSALEKKLNLIKQEITRRQQESKPQSFGIFNLPKANTIPTNKPTLTKSADSETKIGIATNSNALLTSPSSTNKKRKSYPEEDSSSIQHNDKKPLIPSPERKLGEDKPQIDDQKNNTIPPIINSVNKERKYKHFKPNVSFSELKLNNNLFFVTSKSKQSNNRKQNLQAPDEVKNNLSKKSFKKISGRKKTKSNLTIDEAYEIGICGEESIYIGLKQKYQANYSVINSIHEFSYIDKLKDYTISIADPKLIFSKDTVELKTIYLQIDDNFINAAWIDVESGLLCDKRFHAGKFTEAEKESIFVEKKLPFAAELFKKILKLCNSSCIYRISGQDKRGMYVKIEIIWHNAKGESGKPEDLYIRKIKSSTVLSESVKYDPKKDRHIEVKSTRSCGKEIVDFPQTQLRAMCEHLDRYFIYRLYNTGKYHANQPVNIKKIKDPVSKLHIPVNLLGLKDQEQDEEEDNEMELCGIKLKI